MIVWLVYGSTGVRAYGREYGREYGSTVVVAAAAVAVAAAVGGGWAGSVPSVSLRGDGGAATPSPFVPGPSTALSVSSRMSSR